MKNENGNNISNMSFTNQTNNSINQFKKPENISIKIIKRSENNPKNEQNSLFRNDFILNLLRSSKPHNSNTNKDRIKSSLSKSRDYISQKHIKLDNSSLSNNKNKSSYIKIKQISKFSI